MKIFEILLLIFLLPYSYDWLMGFFYDTAYLVGAGMGFEMDLLGDYQWDSYFCVFALLIYLPWYVYIKKRDKDTLSQIPRKKMKLRPIAEYTVIALGMSGVSELWLRFVDGIMYQNNILGMGESMDSFVETWSGGAEESYIWLLLSVVLLGPLVEELIFRGLQYHYTERLRGGWLPILLTAISFGIWHGEPVQVVYTALMGIALAIVYQNSRNFYAPLWIHILNNFMSALPPMWDTDFIYDLLTNIALLMILPALALLIKMARENAKINRQIRSGGSVPSHAAALRSSMIFEKEMLERTPKEQEATGKDGAGGDTRLELKSNDVATETFEKAVEKESQ